MKLVLASKSPRRKQLLQECGFEFECIVKDCEELSDNGLDPQYVAMQNAIIKVNAIQDEVSKDAIVLGSDTVVAIDHQILGKPKDCDDAYRMLSMLSGKTHQVISGVAIKYQDQMNCFCEVSEVTFYELEEELIQKYIESGSVYDKAGSYGIQDMGRLLVKSIKGDYFNIVGLPIARVYRELKGLMKVD